VDPKAQLNFVTPASKETSPNLLEDKCAKVEEGEAIDVVDDEPDSGIERLVDQSAVAGTPGHIKNKESVVDLTAENAVQPIKLTNVVSATKKRKPAAPKKKAPVVGINSVLAAMPPAATKVVVVEETPGDVMNNSEQVASTEAIVAEEVSDSVAETADAMDTVPVEVSPDASAPETPAAVVSKKRPRKASAKKLEAVESAALDPEQGANDDATEGAAPAATETASEEVKPTPKRVKKPATPKPVAVEIVYPPHVLVKQQANKDKLHALATELLQLER